MSLRWGTLSSFFCKSSFCEKERQKVLFREKNGKKFFFFVKKKNGKKKLGILKVIFKR